MNTTKVLKIGSQFDMKNFAATVIANISDSIGDMIVTVAITGITLAYMMQIIHPVYAGTIPGLYIAAMLVQLFIRVVHRFDDEYTTDELAERMIEMEASFKERLDTIIQNQYPL